jgi:hypothetical protein
MDVSFALTLNREVSPADVAALRGACGGNVNVRTGPLGTVVEVYSDALFGAELAAAIEEAVTSVSAAVPAVALGWMIKTDGYVR